MNYTPLTQAHGNLILFTAIIKEVSNMRKHDKGSLGYMIGMMDYQATAAIFWDSYKRSELLEMFARLASTPRIEKLNNGYCLAEVFTKFQNQ